MLGVPVLYRDPHIKSFGLENILLPLGGDVIEVVSPIQRNTTAGRLLAKRGDGGYMIIMQNDDAVKRRKMIEANGAAKVIYAHESEYAHCIQYHPMGIPGSVMPELDSHRVAGSQPSPLTQTFSPWHACGPDYAEYVKIMEQHADLDLVGCVLRLKPGEVDTEGAAGVWQDIFGVKAVKRRLIFTNAWLDFESGNDRSPEGLESITVGVHGRERFEGILNRASAAGLCGDGWINMCGVRWYFVQTDENHNVKERL